MRDTIGRSIAKALGGRKVGNGWMACCPAHHDREPSLSISDTEDGKILVHCHAGCDQRGVVAVLRSLGLWRDYHPNSIEHSTPRTKGNKKRGSVVADETALKIWRSSVSANGTLVETYLAGRGLRGPLPPTLRFHPGLKHPSGGFWPAMVAAVTRGVGSRQLAIHRTFLAPDGTAKASIDPQKMLGPCRGCAVKLAEPGKVLMVGEGIETCLAAMQSHALPAWAALSTSGLLALDLPRHLRDVLVLADGDEAGRAAARGAALRWKREGRRVRIAYAVEGMDFNDMLLTSKQLREGTR
jgi:hypothetical protein